MYRLWCETRVKLGKIRLKKTFLAILALIIIGSTTAQATPYSDYSKPTVSDWIGGSVGHSGFGLRPYGSSSVGLLDPSRLSIDHAVSFGVTSSGDQSLTQALYQSRFSYRLSDPVTLSLMMGVQNLNGNNIPGFNSNNSVFGGFALDYRPSKNVFFHLEMQHLPAGSYTPEYLSPFGYSQLYSDRFLLMNEVGAKYPNTSRSDEDSTNP